MKRPCTGLRRTVIGFGIIISSDFAVKETVQIIIVIRYEPVNIAALVARRRRDSGKIASIIL